MASFFAAPVAQAQSAYASDAVVALPISGLSFPFGVAVDKSNNVFIADAGNNVVREALAADGYATVKIVGGNGFYNPEGVAIDANGNLFVADRIHNAIKEVLFEGGYTTVNTLGSGFSGPYGVAVDANGNVFVADSGNNAVKEILAAGGYNTVNTLSSGFNNPSSVAVDAAGNVFVADYGSYRVKEILAAGNYTTVNDLADVYDRPEGVALDAYGNLFVADIYASDVKEVLASSGYTTVLSLSGAFTNPAGVAINQQGDVIVADYQTNIISRVMTQGANFGPVAVGATASSPLSITFTFTQPTTIAAPKTVTLGAGSLDFSDAGTGNCTATRYYGGVSCTVNLNFAPRFSGYREGAVSVSDSSGNLLATAFLYGTGTAPQLTFGPATNRILLATASLVPSAVAVDGSGNLFYADSTANTVGELLPSEGYSTSHPVASGFNAPSALALDGQGNLFVADTGNNAIKEVIATGGYSTVVTLGSGFNAPTGVAVSGGGNVFVADTGNSAIKEISHVGGYVSIYSVGTGFTHPSSLAVDASGNVFVQDSGTVKKVLAAGNYGVTTSIASGFGASSAIALDSNDDLFIADSADSSVKEILTAGGGAATVIGTGFSSPGGLVVDGGGNLYVADKGNHAIKRLDTVDPPALHFADTAYGATSADSPQTVSVTNVGNQALTLQVPANGSNPSISSGFTIGGSSTCPLTSSTSGPGSLPAGTACTELVSFTPDRVGSISGTLGLTDDNLNAAAPAYAVQTISLNGNGVAAAPSISFNVANQIYGNPPFTVAATSNSSGAFTYSVLSGPATISGNTVTLAGTGSVTLQASQAASANYLAGTATATFLVSAATPSITFSVPNQVYGNPPFTVAATSNSTGTFTYSVLSGPATISGNTVTLTGAGPVTLEAAQTATANYNAGTATSTFLVAPAAPAIMFSVADQSFGSPPFTVAATSNSPGAFTYSVLSGLATIAGNTVTLTGSGTVTLQATQAATANYAAGSATATFRVVEGLTIVATPSSAAVSPGGSVDFALTVSPGGSSTFSHAVQLTATGVPGGASVVFSPASIPSGAGVSQAKMTIETTILVAGDRHRPGFPRIPVAFALLLFPVLRLKRSTQQMKRLMGLLAVGALSLAGLLGTGGCGSGVAVRNEHFTITITATDSVSGAANSTQVDLLVN